MLIGTLETGIIEMELPNQPLEGGKFIHDVEIPLPEIETSGAPWSYVSKKIAENLGLVILDTGVPKEHWFFLPTTRTQKMFNLNFEKVAFG